MRGAHVRRKLDADTQAVVDEAKALGTDRVILAHVPAPASAAEAEAAAASHRAGWVGRSSAPVGGTPSTTTRPSSSTFDGASTIARLVASSPSLGLELDLGWAWIADVDPLGLLRSLPGRVPLVHVKDFTEHDSDTCCPIGEGRWTGPRSSRNRGDPGIEWIVVEQDETAGDELGEAARSLAGIRRLLTRSAVNEAARHLALLTRTIEVVNSSLDLQEVMEAIAHEVAAALGTDACFVYLYDERTDELVLRATHGTLVEDATIAPRMRRGEGITGVAAAERAAGDDRRRRPTSTRASRRFRTSPRTTTSRSSRSRSSRATRSRAP